MRFSTAKPPNYLKGQDRLAYMEERAWVANDFAEYCGREGKYADKAEPFEEQIVAKPIKGTYLDYVARRGTFADKANDDNPEGTGIWGKNGKLEGEELARVKKLFATTPGIIWHGIISPAKELGDKFLNSKEKAMEFTNACLTRFISSTHLQADNVEWYAGWHDDAASGIKHIQFAFCEKGERLNSKGVKGYTQKGVIRKSALADALLNFEEYFSQHRNDVHLARDDLMAKIRPLKARDVKVDFANDLLKLANDLPEVKGRAGYRSKEYEPYRERIDALVDRLIKEVPAIRDSYIQLMSKVKEREERFNKTAGDLKNMHPTDKIAELREDIKVRLGNSIIAFAQRVKFTDDFNKNFAALQASKLAMMQQRQEEAKLRRQKQNEQRKRRKRFSRLFNVWWQSENNRDLVAEFYEHIAKLQNENISNNENNYNDLTGVKNNEI